MYRHWLLQQPDQEVVWPCAVVQPGLDEERGLGRRCPYSGWLLDDHGNTGIRTSSHRFREG